MSRPRDRASAAGLLPGMEARPWKDGKTVTYRYHPAKGNPIALGTDRDAAIRRVLDMNGERPGHGSLAWLWEQWQTGKRWRKLSEGTQADYALAWKQINERFGHMAAGSITSPMVARYVHVERALSTRRADIEKTVMSNLFRHGIMLGVCATNPTIGVEPHGSETEHRMPEPAVLRAYLAWLSQQTPQRRIVGYAAEYMALSGSRRIEYLDLTWLQIDMKDDEPVLGGHVRTLRAKQRGKKRDAVRDLVEISPKLHALLKTLRGLNRDCLYVFPTRDNNAYTTEGFETLWQRCMVAAIEAKVLTKEQRFNFHALRHYYVTIHKAERGNLPNIHSDPRLTSRIYDETLDERREAL